MAKELVISSNRHETRVAVLEDDQLVEIFFQRSHEYSLAGSIHKGRVTRVLPGMQSAFVDLGLERDTFLYVSDFFEESDEYDRIIPEEKPVKAHGSSLGIGPAKVPPSAPPMIAESAAATPERTDEAEGRDRRSRRSRRRRNRGRGFPESKYATESAPAEEEQEIQEPPAVSELDFAVLPGESLAKYRGTEPSESAGAEEEAPQQATSSHVEALLEDFDGDVTAIEDQPEDHTGAADDVEEAMPSEKEEQAEPLLESETEEIEEDAANGVEDEGADGAEVLDEQEEFDDSEIREMILEAQMDAEARSGPEPEEGELESEDEGPHATADVEPDVEAKEDDDQQPVEEAASAAGEIEPIRKPHSLTATLREQGPRYMHRVTRRNRRKTRPLNEEATPESKQPDYRSDASRTVIRPEKAGPSIADLLKEGQEILVQVAKEPLGQKGARITSHIALPGRYVVYMPTLEHMGVSRKISTDEERLRLKKILQAQRSSMSGGFIVRTAGEGKTEREIVDDMQFLYNLWQDIRQKAEKKRAPALLHHDLDIVQRVLRDQFADSFKAIWIDSEEIYENVLSFVQRFQPVLIPRVKLYTRPAPIFDAFGITQELEKALRPKVWLKSGGYIVINQTEALVAIDVNTGKFVGKSNRLEDTIVKTNLEAVREIVRQIRLRDLGGIIVVDFIDMDERKNRQKVMQGLEEAMQADRAPSKVLQFNDFGLVAITRKRVKQSLERTLCSPCPYCEGAGYVKSVDTVIGEILQEAQNIAGAVDGENVVLRVNPDVAKVLKSNSNQYLEEMEGILKRPVLVKGDPLLHQEKFDIG
ncbi:MAG: Rne/Rng family ribonuclease [Bryobacterales bacterium]|nr:Rne/Rng family ribonuclease [Bryobacterales bacterium]